MGTLYCGPYAESSDSYSHEGYADRKMPDGTFSNGEWSARYPHDAHVAFVAACECGWRGATEHPPTDEGQEHASDEWWRDHLQARIDAEARRHNIRGDVLLGSLRTIRESIHGDVLTDRQRGQLDVIEAIEHVLDELAHGGH